MAGGRALPHLLVCPLPPPTEPLSDTSASDQKQRQRQKIRGHGRWGAELRARRQAGRMAHGIRITTQHDTEQHGAQSTMHNAWCAKDGAWSIRYRLCTKQGAVHGLWPMLHGCGAVHAPHTTRVVLSGTVATSILSSAHDSPSNAHTTTETAERSGISSTLLVAIAADCAAGSVLVSTCAAA